MKTQKVEFKKIEPVAKPWIVKKKRKRFTKRSSPMSPRKNFAWKEKSLKAREGMKKDMVAF